MNSSIIIIVIIAIALVIFLFLKNQKDKRKFIDQLNKDYPHKDDKENDIEIEDADKV